MHRKKYVVLIMVFAFLMIFNCDKNSTTESQPIIIEQITNLIGYWSFSGNVNDESTNNNHGVVTGATLGDDRFGNENSAYYFDGIDDYITIKSADGFIDFEDPETKFTLSAWCMTLEKTSGFIFSNTSEDGWHDVRLSNSVPRFGIRDSEWTGTVLQSDEAISSNEWHHIVGVFNDPEMILYVDGQNKGITQFVGEILSFGGLEDGGIRIGAYYLPDGYLFKGGIDDIRIYNRNLNAEEVLALYNETNKN